MGKMYSNKQFISLKKIYTLHCYVFILVEELSSSSLNQQIKFGSLSQLKCDFSPRARSSRRSRQQNLENFHCTKPHRSLHNQMSYNKDITLKVPLIDVWAECGTDCVWGSFLQIWQCYKSIVEMLIYSFIHFIQKHKKSMTNQSQSYIMTTKAQTKLTNNDS